MEIEMKTKYLNQFLKNVGDTVHNLNSICVGLNGVKHGYCNKPADMIISWTPTDLGISAHKARIYAQKTALVFAVEAFYSYCENMKYLLLTDKELESDFKKTDKNPEKYSFLLKKYSNEIENYRRAALILTIHWRNKIIHMNSNAKLLSDDRAKLSAAKDIIAEFYSGLNINSTISHFETNDPTLKDVSSLVAMTIYLARRLDEIAIKSIVSAEALHRWITRSEIGEEFSKIAKTPSSETKTRKISYFLNIHFNVFDKNIINDFVKAYS